MRCRWSTRLFTLTTSNKLVLFGASTLSCLFESTEPLFPWLDSVPLTKKITRRTAVIVAMMTMLTSTTTVSRVVMSRHGLSLQVCVSVVSLHTSHVLFLNRSPWLHDFEQIVHSDHSPHSPEQSGAPNAEEKARNRNEIFPISSIASKDKTVCYTIFCEAEKRFKVWRYERSRKHKRPKNIYQIHIFLAEKFFYLLSYRKEYISFDVDKTAHYANKVLIRLVCKYLNLGCSRELKLDFLSGIL